MTVQQPPKVALSQKRLGLIELFRSGSANIISTIPAQLLSQTMLSGRMFWKWHSIAGPDEMRRVLVENEPNYPKAPVVRRILRPAIKQSMFLVEGAEHQWQRRASTPYFTLRESMKSIPAFLKAAVVQAERLPDEKTCRMDALEYMVSLTLSVIVSVTCSTGNSVNTDQIRDAFADYLDTTARLSPLDLLSLPPRLASALNRSDADILDNLRSQIDAIVEQRMNEGSGDHDDLLQGLINSIDPATGAPMTVEQVRDNILLFVVAGHETTANGLGWAVHMLATHPQVQQQARDEAIAAFNGKPEDLHKSLPLISQIVDETLRLYPPLPLLLRTTKGKDTVGGCPVGKGSFMFIPLYALHRNQTFWSQPDDFCPERFAPDSPNKIAKHQYLPFSAGPRSCLGSGFALLEMRIVLADFLCRFQFSAIEGRVPEPIALITLKPEGGVWIDVERLEGPDISRHCTLR